MAAFLCSHSEVKGDTVIAVCCSGKRRWGPTCEQWVFWVCFSLHYSLRWELSTPCEEGQRGNIPTWWPTAPWHRHWKASCGYLASGDIEEASAFSLLLLPLPFFWLKLTWESTCVRQQKSPTFHPACMDTFLALKDPFCLTEGPFWISKQLSRSSSFYHPFSLNVHFSL